MALHRNIGMIAPTGDSTLLYADGGGGTMYQFDPVAAATTDPPLTQPLPVIDVKEVPIQQTAYSETAEQTQITAAIFEADSNKMLFGVTVTLLRADGTVIGTVMMANDSNTFTVFSNDPATELLSFTKEDYTSLVVPVSFLLDTPQVYLHKVSSNNIMFIGFGLGLLLLLRKKRKVGAFSDVVNVQNVIAVSAAVIAFKGFGLFDNLLNTLGLGGDPTGPAQADPDSPFKPTYWQKFTTFPAGAITEQTAAAYATTIKGALGYFQDDYEQVLSVFSSLKSKAQVSFVAWAFNELFHDDMLAFLSGGTGLLPWDGLSNAHLKTIINLVNALPTN